MVQGEALSRMLRILNVSRSNGSYDELLMELVIIRLMVYRGTMSVERQFRGHGKR